MNRFTFQFSGYFKLLCILLAGCWLQPAFGSSSAPLTLTCPEDLKIYLPTGICGTYLYYDSLEWSSSTPVEDYYFIPSEAHFFTTGETTVMLFVIDTSSTLATCTFTVTIIEYRSGKLNCEENVTVDLDGHCEREITYDLVLPDSSFGCPDNILISLLSPTGENLGNVIDVNDIGKVFTFQAENILSGKTCTGTITIAQGTLPPAITCPPDFQVFCHASTDPSITGEPLITGCFDRSALDLTFTDIKSSSICDGDSIAFAYQRTWQAVDTFNNITTCVQIIRGRRIELLEVVFPPNFDDTDQPSIACNSAVPPQSLADTSITGIPLIKGLSPEASACGISMSFSDTTLLLCGGQYQILRAWTVSDVCNGTFIKHTQTIEIKDKTGLIFTAPDTVFVSYNADCGDQTNFPAINLTHACSDFSVEIITPWGTLNTNGGLLTVPLIPGTYNATYRVTDGCGNVKQKLTKVFITDTVLPPCPTNATITCNEFNDQFQAPLAAGDFSVLDQFGIGRTAANCNLSLEQDVQVLLNSCVEGQILRTFTVSANGQDFSCVQKITVRHISDFVVQFPKDTLVQCSVEQVNAGTPVILNADCENIQVTFTDDFIPAEAPDACVEVLRTWKVINTCVNGPEQSQEVVEEPETVLNIDLNGDSLLDERTFRDSWTSSSQPGLHADPASNPWDGYITYQQSIGLIDEVAPIITNCSIPNICLAPGSCFATVQLPMPQVQECSPEVDVTAQMRIGNTWQDGLGPFSSIARGTYEVRYYVSDKCGHQDTCQTSVKVKDCEAPEARCLANLSVQLQISTMTIEIYALDLNDNSTDNCPGQLTYSFSSDVNEISRVFDCSNEGSNQVELWVTDVAGNQSTCTMNLIILPPPNTTCGNENIAGYILTENGIGIAHVQVGASVETDINGYYQVPSNSGPVITPYKDINIANGVTTFDAVLLTKHVLGITPLNSPYKIISADINKSNSVTTFDAVEMRKIILNIYTNSIPNNTSWRFIPAGFVFPNPTNPFASSFPESAAPGPEESLDFIGVKIGDLNNSVNPVNFSAEATERSFRGTLPFLVQDIWLEEGDQIAVPFRLPPIAIYGYQFALAFDPEKMSWQGLLPGFAGMENFGFGQIGEGILSTSWHRGVPFTPAAEQPAFTLLFSARSEGFLSEWLRPAPHHLAAEAYSSSLEFLKPEFLFKKEESFRLLHLQPNPFTSRTRIGFYLPQAGQVSLSLLSPTGQVVKTKMDYFKKGKNSLEIEAAELPGKGVFYFRLHTKDGTEEGKLIRF